MKAYWGRYPTGDYETPESAKLITQAYRELFSSPPPYVALDVETPSLKDQRVMGVGFATPSNDNFYFDLADSDFPWHLLLPSGVRKIWHNATFDLAWEALGKYGADLDNIEDTAIITRMLNMNVVLSVAALDTTARTESAGDLLKRFKVKNMTQLPWSEVALKCINDARVTLKLYEKYRSKVNQTNYLVDLKVTSLLLHQSHRGIQLDKLLVNNIEYEMAKQVATYDRILPFNYRSPQQVAIALGSTKPPIFLPWVRSKATGKSHPDTSKGILENLDHLLPMTIIKARKYTKLHGVIKSMVDKDRVFSHFHLDSATRRITSENIQMHNLPVGSRPDDIIPESGPIRRVLVPDSGEWTRFDLSQVELRVLTRYTGDPRMSQALNTPNGQGPDIHETTMNTLGIHSRVMAKNFNFGSIFGGDIPILATFTGIKDHDLLRRYQQLYFSTYAATKNWIDQQRYQGLRDGFVTTLYGQRLSLDIPMRMGVRHAGNCAINYPIQGSAAEIFKRILIALSETIPISDFVLQVHDEELIEGRHILPEQELSHITDFWTPLETSVIKRWQ